MTVQNVFNTQPNPAPRAGGFLAKALVTTPAHPFDQLLARANASKPTAASGGGLATDARRSNTLRNDRRSQAASHRTRRDDRARATDRHSHDFKKRADRQDRPSARSTRSTSVRDSHQKNTEKTGDFNSQPSVSYAQPDASDPVVQTGADVSTGQGLETQTSDTQHAGSFDPLGIITAQNVEATAGQTEADAATTGSLTQALNLKTQVTIDALNTAALSQAGVVSTTTSGDETANVASTEADQAARSDGQSLANQTIISGAAQGSPTGLDAIAAGSDEAQGLPEIAQLGAKLTGAAAVSRPGQGTQNTAIQNINPENLNGENPLSGQAAADSAQTSDPNDGEAASRDHQSRSEADGLKAVIKTAAAPINEAPASTAPASSPNLIHVTANPVALPVSAPAQAGVAADASATGAPLLSEGDATQSNANISRVIRGMHGVINQNGGAVTLRLSPPEMGIVRIEMQIQNGTVTAQLHAEHESARSLLSQQLGQLRHALESQGLSVDRLHVQTMGQDTAAQTADQGSDQSAQDGRSRGQYTGAGQRHRDPDSNPDAELGGDRSDPPASRFEQALNMVA